MSYKALPDLHYYPISDLTSHILFLPHWPPGTSLSLPSIWFDSRAFAIAFSLPLHRKPQVSLISSKPLLKCHLCLLKSSNPTPILSSIPLICLIFLHDTLHCLTSDLLICFFVHFLSSTYKLQEGMDFVWFILILQHQEQPGMGFHSININAWISHLSKTWSEAADQISPK